MRIGIDPQFPRDLRRDGDELQAQPVEDHAVVIGHGGGFVILAEHLLLTHLVGRGALSDGHVQGAALPVADQVDRNGLAGRDSRDEEGQGLFGRHVAPVHAKDDIAGLNPGPFRAFAGLDGLDDFAARPFDAERRRQIVGDRGDADAEIAARHVFPAPKLLDDRRRIFGRNGKTDPDIHAGRREDLRIDTDDVALHVEERATGVSAIDRGVGLQEPVIGADAGHPLHRRDDSRRHGRPDPERVADGDHPVTRPGQRAVAELDEGEGFAPIDLEHGEIAVGIVADQFGLVFRPVRKRYGDLRHRPAIGCRDDVIVRDHVAIGGNEEAGAERGAFAILRLAVARRSLIALTAIEQLFERCALEGIARLLHLDALTRGDIDHGGLQLFGQFGEACRGTGARDDRIHPGIVILRDLRACRKAGRQRKRRAAGQKYARQSVGISHVGVSSQWHPWSAKAPGMVGHPALRSRSITRFGP